MLSIRSGSSGEEQVGASSQRPPSDDATQPWYIVAFLLPSLITAILLGVLASQGALWLWPIVVLLGLPPLIIAWPKPSDGDRAAWHLRQFQRPG